MHHKVRNSEICAKQIRLILQMKIDFFVVSFEGAARDIFFKRCRDDM